MVNIIPKTFQPAYYADRKPSQVVRVWCLLISGLFYLTAAINTAGAATYYLDAPNGDDSNSGTIEAPWKTMERAMQDWSGGGSKVNLGDMVILRDGNYGTVNFDYSYDPIPQPASWDDKIIYKAAVGASPVFGRLFISGSGGQYERYWEFDGIDVTVTVPYIEYDSAVLVYYAKSVHFKNMKISGYWTNTIRGGLTSAVMRFQVEETHDFLIENCEITSGEAAIRFVGGQVTAPIIIRNNHIHDIAGHGISLNVQSGEKITIENNYLHNAITVLDYQVFRCNENITGNQSLWNEWHANKEKLTQDVTGAEGYFGKWWTDENHVMVYVTTDIPWEVGYTIRGVNISFICEPVEMTRQEYSHQGAIMLRADNAEIKNNTIHGMVPVRTFENEIYEPLATTGYCNLLVENNLFYDAPLEYPLLLLEDLGTNVIIRNNTFVGHRGSDYPSGSRNGYYYRNPARLVLKSGRDGSGIKLYNNIIVGALNLDSNMVNYEEDYNIIYSVLQGGWQSFLKGNNTIICSDGSNEPKVFDSGFFIDPDYSFGHGRVCDYRLANGSPAIGFGNSIYAPLTDILGNSRGANPDAGCYESNTSDPNNPTPVLAIIGDKSVDENSGLTFDVNATDPNGEPITYSAQGLPSGAMFDPLTGEFAWTPSYNQAGSYQVTFIASDGNSQDSETITITVNNVNRAPVLGAISDQSVDENSILSLSVDASDPDGQALTYSVSGLPAGAVFVSQTLTWTPSYDQAGAFPVTFTADDGLAQDSEAITITVINVNRTPVLTAINNQSVWADDPLTFTIDATDPDGDAVTYSASNLPSDATFTGQDFDWTPSQGQMGSYDVTFIASDGQLQDSQTVTITVDVDSLAPTVTNLSPAVGAIQVPLNNLITLNVTDAGKGIEPKSVKIKVKTNSNPNNNTVYFGDMDHYISLLGDCRRIGNNADYKFVFQPTQDLFYYDQTVTITVNATDLAGNVMDEYSYSFATEMHSFGQNKQVNSGLDNNDRPVTVCDSSGNIWTAWHAGSAGSRDIYIGTLAAGEENFGGTIQLTDNTNDQCNPAVALDSNDKLYVVWQDNREGDWDIYVSTSVDGISWSTETRVNDPNEGNQVNPALVIDGQSPNQAHVVWQDDRAGNQDICIATSSDGFATKTVSQITTDSFDQVEPAIAADSDNTIYVVWTDGRNGSNDIYGAASNNPWTNVAIVSNANNQSSPTIAAESVGAILHLLWVDDTLGDKDIYYASSDGLPGSPLTGSSIIDDTSGADQLEPAIAVTSSRGNNLKVFACWQDWRNTDTDLYFAELSSSSGTNVFVGDGGSSTYQGEPVIGIDEYSHPYLIWADNRSTNTEIYYAGSTFVEPVALASELVAASASSSTTVGADPQAITTVDDVSVVVPAGACSYDVAITVTKIANPQAFAAPCLGGYDFGPSGIQFSQPVTITIPYPISESNGSTLPYWYNSLTGALSQQGITDVQDIVISPTLHALSFKTTHFTAFYLLGGGAAAVLGGGGGGGCSVSAGGEGNMVEFALPYIGLVVVMAILKVRDARERKARST